MFAPQAFRGAQTGGPRLPAEEIVMKTIVVVTQNKIIAQAIAECVRTVVLEIDADPAIVLPASSINEVLDILSRRSIDVLLIDQRLGEMSGEGLIRWLGKGLAGTVTILLTSDPQVLAEPWKFVSHDINDVLSRPIERALLKRTLQRWLVGPFVQGPFGEAFEPSDWCSEASQGRSRKPNRPTRFTANPRPSPPVVPEPRPLAIGRKRIL
jgi:CheY-like chemotaxis protein